MNTFEYLSSTRLRAGHRHEKHKQFETSLERNREKAGGMKWDSKEAEKALNKNSRLHRKWHESESHSVVSDSVWPHAL